MILIVTRENCEMERVEKGEEREGEEERGGGMDRGGRFNLLPSLYE